MGALSHLKYKRRFVSEGHSQCANHREEKCWKMTLYAVQMLYLFPHQPSPTFSDTHNVLPEMTLSESIVHLWIFTHTLTSDHFSVVNKNNTTALQGCAPVSSVNSHGRFVISNYGSCSLFRCFTVELFMIHPVDLLCDFMETLLCIATVGVKGLTIRKNS